MPIHDVLRCRLTPNRRPQHFVATTLAMQSDQLWFNGAIAGMKLKQISTCVQSQHTSCPVKTKLQATGVRLQRTTASSCRCGLPARLQGSAAMSNDAGDAQADIATDGTWQPAAAGLQQFAVSALCTSCKAAYAPVEIRCMPTATPGERRSGIASRQLHCACKPSNVPSASSAEHRLKRRPPKSAAKSLCDANTGSSTAATNSTAAHVCVSVRT